jgi:uncharacterized SAM-binding protein YcdF (DUF218 family)
MFLISKTLGVFLIPPGILIFLLLTLIFFLIKKKIRISLILSITTLILLYFFSTEVGKNVVLSPLENGYPFPKEINCQEIVVLGGGVIPHSPDENNRASVDPKVAKRLYTAFKLWKRIKKPILVSGGSVFRNSESEASAMKRFLVELGIPEDEIIEEKKSRNTLENALFTREILETEGIDKICLVTSAFHMPRSVLIFKTAGFKVIPVPSDYRIFRTPYSWYSFLPAPSYLRDSMFGIREYVGILYFELIQRWCKNKKKWNTSVINNGTMRDLLGYSGTRNIRIL